jgi:putative DNA modification/repair radical SAM protein
VLLSNACAYDCSYCVNRTSNDTPRATFTPKELAELTMHFYRRNYIEGLFLSSAVLKDPDHTCERMIETLRLLRETYGFNGYIHAKAIPGADAALLTQLGHLADRLSVNIELPSQKSLRLLAPDKTKTSILGTMGTISNKITESRSDIVRYRHAPRFSAAGQSTQLIVGATQENDYQILKLTAALYKKYALRRVFYSAYIPVAQNPLLPALDVKPPLLREHRLYQADWLLRFYGFSADELLDEEHASFNPYVDPKCNWALNHMHLFPVEINRAPQEMLMRVPGIGLTGTERIVSARRVAAVDFDGLKKMGISVKRAQYFITCNEKMLPGLKTSPDHILGALVSDRDRKATGLAAQQLSFFQEQITREDIVKCISGQM